MAANEKKIFVGNLDFKVTEADLKMLFECSVGPVEGINIRRDRVTKQPRGFAFVTFHSAADAQRAIDTMHNVVHRGRTLTIKPQIARGSGSASSSTSGAGGKHKKHKKPSLWGDKANGGWYTPGDADKPGVDGTPTEQSTASPVASAINTHAGGNRVASE